MNRHLQLDQIAIQIYGPMPPNFPISNGEVAEAVIHELCHQVFLDISCSPGAMRWTFDAIDRALSKMPDDKADHQELSTLAAELLVCETLGLKVRTLVLRKKTADNLRAYQKRQITKRQAQETVMEAVKEVKAETERLSLANVLAAPSRVSVRVPQFSIEVQAVADQVVALFERYDRN